MDYFNDSFKHAMEDHVQGMSQFELDEMLNSYPKIKKAFVALLLLKEWNQNQEELDLDDWEVDLANVLFN